MAKGKDPKKEKEPVHPPLAVLVTGATSTLGRLFCRQLYYDPAIRYVVGIGVEPKPYYFDQFDRKKFHYMRVDITHLRELRNLFYGDFIRDLKLDAVVHLAFRNRPNEPDPEQAHRLNIQGTQNVLNFSLEIETITKFVFRSSHIVYRADPLNPVYLDEDSELNFSVKADRWVKDRVDADLFVRSKMDHPRVKIVVLRLSNLIGEGIHSQLQELLRLRLAFLPMGFDPMVNLLHPRDAVRALQLALHNRDVRGVFNVVGRDTAPLSVFVSLNRVPSLRLPGPLIRIVNRIQRSLGVTDYNYDVHGDRLHFSCLLDGRRYKEAVGYEPINHIELG
jgi:UDP-glucose 4-epimerase